MRSISVLHTCALVTILCSAGADSRELHRKKEHEQQILSSSNEVLSSSDSTIPTAHHDVKHVGKEEFQEAEKIIEDEFNLNKINRMITGSFRSNTQNFFAKLWDREQWGDLGKHGRDAKWFVMSYFSNVASNFMFPYTNFVRGFHQPGFMNKVARWLPWSTQTKEAFAPAKAGELMEVVTYGEVAKEFSFAKEYDFFNEYYTGRNVPSNEDNKNHKNGIKWLDRGVKFSRMTGREAIETLYDTEPRLAFDKQALIKAGWDGFKYFGPRDIKYASNGIFGWDVMDEYLQNEGTKDTLGILVTYSVFGAHLVQQDDNTFVIDLEWMSKYRPLPGYAKMGGRAVFEYDPSVKRLRTKSLEYDGTTHVPSDDDEDVNRAFEEESRFTGWMYAEKAIIASLLSMTNLVMHVKDLHLEIAAAFQATTFDAFTEDPTHPIRRLLDPFIHRSVQATNDNFKLLFEYKAAEFSLAPLPYDEQLKLIDEAIKTNPLNLAAMDMKQYAKARNMDPEFSKKDGDGSKFFWTWHYRALTVQNLYRDLVTCWIEKNAVQVENDDLLEQWWQDMMQYIPAFKRVVDSTKPGYDENLKSWANDGTINKDALVNVISTIVTWLSWIHEDVGHAAAAYVYSPVHTPMCLVEDGVGIPLRSYTFNVAAYRGFVFLHRAVLLDDPPGHWFHGEDRQCFDDFQSALRELGSSDPAFGRCDEKGFYTCVDRVETAVSS